MRLSAPLLIIAYFVFQTDARHFKDSAPFRSLIAPCGIMLLSLCDMLKLCLPSSHSPRLFLSLTPNTSNCLQPASSKSLSVCLSVCLCLCLYVCVCVWVGGWVGVWVGVGVGGCGCVGGCWCTGRGSDV